MITQQTILNALEKSKIPFQQLGDTVSYVVESADILNTHTKKVTMTFDTAVKEFLNSKSRIVEIVNPIKSTQVLIEDNKTFRGKVRSLFTNIIQLKKPTTGWSNKVAVQKNYDLRKYNLTINESKTDFNNPAQSVKTMTRLIKPSFDARPAATGIICQPFSTLKPYDAARFNF